MECQPHRRREPGRTLPELPEGAHTWISDFWPQDCERTSFCCLKPPVCGTLLWQPQEMNTGPFGQGIPSPLALTRPTLPAWTCVQPRLPPTDSPRGPLGPLDNGTSSPSTLRTSLPHAAGGQSAPNGTLVYPGLSQEENQLGTTLNSSE